MAGFRVQPQPPSLELGVRVVRVDWLEQEQLLERGGGGSLFLRCYVPAGDGRRRLRVDTREVPCGAGCDLRWGELARFQRWGGGGQPQPAAAPAAGGIAFELRWRLRPSSGLAAALLGATGARVRPSSRVLARGELPWADVSSQPAAERWLTLSQVGRELCGCKAPKLLVEVKAVHAAVVATERKRTPGAGGMTECCCRAAERCGQCGWVGSEEDMFLAATFSQQH